MLLGHLKPQSSRPARLLCTGKARTAAAAEATKRQGTASEECFFPNFRCFLNVIYPYASARFVALKSREQKYLPDALSCFFSLLYIKHWRLIGVAQAIDRYHVHRKEHSNVAAGVVWPREVHPKLHYREGFRRR